MGKHPVYRLMDGRIVCQEAPGARWKLIDRDIVETMLMVFDGVSLNNIEEHSKSLWRNQN